MRADAISVGVATIGLAILLAFPPSMAAQALPGLAGTWLGSCAECAPNAMPGGAARMPTIRVSESTLTIHRDGRPAEIYRLDGTETQLPDGRTATGMVSQAGVVLATVRRRGGSRDAVDQTIIRHTYRVSDDRLTIERSAQAIRPGEPPSDVWKPIGTVSYQRD